MSSTSSFPTSDRKISETLLDFAEPLLKGLGGGPSPHSVREALQIAWTIWNAVVLEQTSGNGAHFAEIRKLMSLQSIPIAFSRPPHELLIERKQTIPRFTSDHRMMGEFTLELREGGWVLRLEARTPADRRKSEQ